MKVLKTVVMVVGVVAAVVATAGLLAPVAVGAALGTVGLTLATVSAIGAVASIAGGILTSLTAKKPSSLIGGSATDWKADPQAGIPYMVGRTFNAGNIVKREAWGKDNEWQGFTTVYSLGPIQEVEAFTADRTPITFNAGGNAIGGMATWMYLWMQLGMCPTPVAMNNVIGYPGWSATSKLSGLAASNWFLRFDTKEGKKYSLGIPSPGIIGHGVKVYDPRLDSTQPGGSGACRPAQEETYVYSENPSLHTLTWALGRYQNGKRRMGVGFPASSIDMQSFISWANVCDANNWKIGGVLYSTDDKWNIMKTMAQAGGAEPMQLGGKLSVNYSAPRVSVATITSKDMVGRGTVVGSQKKRDRINGVVPRIKSEAHGWQVIPLDVVRVPALVAEDGRERTKERDYQLVQQVKQGAELAAYDVYNAREFGPIELKLKIQFIGLPPGSAVTLDIPEMNLNGQKALLGQRTLDVLTGAVSVQLKSETDGKHPFCLGKTGVAPPTPSLTAPLELLTPAPEADDWIMGGVLLSSSSGQQPCLRFAGTVDNVNAEGVIFDYRIAGSTEWIGGSIQGPNTTTHDITSLVPGESYEGSIRYIFKGVAGDRRITAPVSTGSLAGTPPEWSDVIDDGGKPDDNATVGAPTGTNVAGVAAETIVTNTATALANSSAALTASEQAAADADEAINAATGALASKAAAEAAKVLAEGASTQAAADAALALARKDEAVAAASTATGQATTATGQAVIATNAASAAATSQQISAAYANTKSNIIPNGDFESSSALWTSSGPISWVTGGGYGGRWQHNGAASGSIEGPNISINPNRRLKAVVEWAQHAANCAHYAGFICLSAADANLGTIYFDDVVGQVFPLGTVYTKQQFFEGIDPALPNPVYTTGGKFPPGTAKIRPLILSNYTSVGGAIVDWMFFVAYDETESATASAQASVAIAQAAAASASASAASTSQTLSAGHASTALTQAGIATTQAGIATAAGASASASASLSASFAGIGIFLNTNSRFTDWAGGSGTLPAGWASWVGGELNARVAGDTGGYAYQVEVVATQASGMYQQPPGMQGKKAAGFYVVEADITLVSGSLQGSGMYIVQSGVLADEFNFVTAIGSTGTPGKRYKISKLIQFFADTTSWDYYLMTSWAGFGAMDAKIIKWHQCSIRDATPQEIRDKTVLAPLQTTVATHDTQLTALAAADIAMASSVTTLSATLSNYPEGSINRNPAFIGLAGAPPLAPSWDYWFSTPAGAYTGAGRSGPLAWVINSAAGTTTGIATSENYPMTPGWYVMDLIFEGYDGGTFEGAGVYISGKNSANAEIDTPRWSLNSLIDQTGNTVFGQSMYKIFRTKKLFQMTAPTLTQFGFVLATNWSQFGGQPYKQIAFHHASVRAATPQEIRDQTVLGPLEATVTSQSTAIATNTARLASYLNRVSAGSGVAEVELVALDAGGVTTSAINLRAAKISLGSLTTPALEISGGVSTFNGELNVGAGSGARVNITKDLIRVYDSSGVLRVRLGVW